MHSKHKRHSFEDATSWTKKTDGLKRKKPFSPFKVQSQKTFTIQRWWLTTPSATTHTVLRARGFNAHSHMPLGDFNGPHDGVEQGLTVVSSFLWHTPLSPPWLMWCLTWLTGHGQRLSEPLKLHNHIFNSVWEYRPYLFFYYGHSREQSSCKMIV